MRSIIPKIWLVSDGQSPTPLDSSTEVIAWLVRIESKLDAILSQKPHQDYYSTADIAQILGKSEYTIREWCRRKHSG